MWRILIHCMCCALYFFQATDSDELTIAEGEELEILEKDGDGWCKVSSKLFQLMIKLHLMHLESYISNITTSLELKNISQSKKY